MHKVIVSAPGKLHLSGEHAVVSGKPALLVATSKRVFVTVEQSKSDVFEAKTPIPQNFLDALLDVVQKKWQQKLANVSLSINSAVPIGAGMGSSGAIAVATIGALQQFLGKSWDKGEINEIAYELEKHLHKNPSGGDNTIATFGGLLWYRREFEFLKTFWLLPFKIPKSFGQFFIINTSRAETTGDLIAHVKSLDELKRTQIFLEVETLTKQITQAIHDEDKAKFMNGIVANERALERLGIVSPLAQKLIKDIEKVGGAAKVTGAGGIKAGSGVVLIIHENAQEIQKIAKQHNFSAELVTLGGEGVKIEQVVV